MFVQEIEKVCISYAKEYHEDRRKDFANGVDDSNEWLWEVSKCRHTHRKLGKINVNFYKRKIAKCSLQYRVQRGVNTLL